ncbi:MAG: response regulator [Candidatus Bathyarchaeia archaeon]|jgi:DNA-binding NtrC family response regulator
MNESVLVVDDDAAVRKTLSSILSLEGYVVETRENGKQALKAVEEEVFDVALIDIQLPDIKGVDLLCKLKAKQPRMIRIIITGYPSVDNAIKAINEGADGYVLKPFDPQQLLETVRKALNEKNAEKIRIFMDMEKNSRFTEQFQKPKGSMFKS